jgi:uncharacterized integral membrane protein
MRANVGHERSNNISGREQDDEGKRSPDRDWSALKAYALLFLLIILIVLVIRNSQLVQMDFVAAQGLADLMWVMLGCAVLGATIGYLLATLYFDRSNELSIRDRSGDLSTRIEGNRAVDQEKRDSLHW